MDIIRAKEIVRTLADGVDPTTGEILPAESVYNAPEVIRALFTILEQVDYGSAAKAADALRNAGKPWTAAEDDKLCDEYLSKQPVSDIAREHGRSYGAIESRLEHLGLKKKPFWLFRKKRT